MKSAASILRSHDFLEAREKSQKHISREFQDYAYRLASDLGDLPHKGIYMRLAKTIDRSLMEQAAIFALEYFNEPNKGKLFMWKLSTLRAEMQKKKDIKNFEGTFVMSKMANLFDLLSKSIAMKQEKEMDTDRRTRLGEFAKKVNEVQLAKRQKQHKILELEGGIGGDSQFLSSLGFKLYLLNISNKLSQLAKARLKDRKNIVVGHRERFLENKYKDLYFSGALLTRFFSLIPLKEEEKYIKEIRRLLLPGGVIYLETTTDKVDSESWQDIMVGEKVYIRYEKKNDKKKVLELLKRNNFLLLQEFELEKGKAGILASLI